MNTNSTTTYFSTEIGLYIAFLTEHPEVEAQGFTPDDACEQLTKKIMEIENGKYKTCEKE